jgi:hypothetical protein
VQNYFNYFTEIEEHFQRRRGSILLLSTLDWALIETWREAGIPLEAVLRGIDDAFDKYEARQSKRPQRRINGLAWCSQAVLESAEQQKEAALGLAPAATATNADAGFERQRIADHFESAAQALDAASINLESIHESGHQSWGTSLAALALRLRHLADSVTNSQAEPLDLEAVELQVSALEEKLFATLTAHVPEQLLLQFKTEAARDLATYRSRLSVVQLRQVEQQFVHKRMLEHYHLPRLSLFYMKQI